MLTCVFAATSLQLHSITTNVSDSRLVFCSARASLPLNVDLEMTFPMQDSMQSYKPKFDLPSEGQAVQSIADQQTAAGGLAAHLHCI